MVYTEGAVPVDALAQLQCRLVGSCSAAHRPRRHRRAAAGDRAPRADRPRRPPRQELTEDQAAVADLPLSAGRPRRRSSSSPTSVTSYLGAPGPAAGRRRQRRRAEPPAAADRRMDAAEQASIESSIVAAQPTPPRRHRRAHRCRRPADAYASARTLTIAIIVVGLAIVRRRSRC